MLNYNNNEYAAVEGNDERIWWSWNQEGYRPHPESHRTLQAPTLVVLGGRVTMYITGVDYQIYYSFLEDAASNNWTPWMRIPGDAYTDQSPAVTTIQEEAYIAVNRLDRHLGMQRMTVSPRPAPVPDAVSFNAHWGREPNGVMRPAGNWTSQSPGIFGQMTSTAAGCAVGNFVGYGISSLITGRDDHLYGATVCAEDWGAPLDWNRLEDGECLTQPDVARGGSLDRVDPSNQAAESRLLVACEGMDGNVWTNYTTNRGASWGGWSSTTDGAGPSTRRPAVNNQGGNFDLRITWNGEANHRFPDHSVIEKTINFS
ncbi:hypothetical protein ACIGAN_26325 [Streptomyces sp. NPDC085931]|uniref:hypothetical protein n=1 Tax=Streptomyces sp. NPDC085931 TaxID=3365740 RepID=UPI0037D6E0ED